MLKKLLLTLILFIFTLIFFFWPRIILAQNLLSNGDFESGNTEFWSSSGGSATATISSELIHNGIYSLKVQHDKSSSYGFQQVIKDLEGGMFYELVGFGATKDPQTASYFLRVAWYETNDGSGSQLTSPIDTEKATNIDGEWVQFSMIVQSPTNAHSAKVRLVLTTKNSGVSASAYFDDILFQESVAPTPTPTLEPTDMPTPTSTPTPRPPTPTPTPKQTVVPSLTPKPTFKTASESGEVLGEKEATLSAFYPYEATEGAEENEATSSAKNKLWPKIFLVVGLLLVFVSAFWLWYRVWYTQSK